MKISKILHFSEQKEYQQLGDVLNRKMLDYILQI